MPSALEGEKPRAEEAANESVVWLADESDEDIEVAVLSVDGVDASAAAVPDGSVSVASLKMEVRSGVEKAVVLEPVDGSTVVGDTLRSLSDLAIVEAAAPQVPLQTLPKRLTAKVW